MPNWCGNVLAVTGPKEDIAAFKAKAVREEKINNDGEKEEKTDFSFDNFIPMPDEIRNTISPSKDTEIRREELKKKYGASDWYKWACDNWGVKWDVLAELIDDEEENISYMFDSAWGPPIDGIVTISAKYPACIFTLEYEEGGMAFWGEMDIKAGCIIKEETGQLEYGICPHCNEDVQIKDKRRECPLCNEHIDKLLPIEEGGEKDGKPESDKGSGEEGVGKDNPAAV